MATEAPRLHLSSPPVERRRKRTPPLPPGSDFEADQSGSSSTLSTTSNCCFQHRQQPQQHTSRSFEKLETVSRVRVRQPEPEEAKPRFSRSQTQILKKVFSEFENELLEYKESNGRQMVNSERTQSMPGSLNRLTFARIEEGSLREKLFKNMPLSRKSDQPPRRPIHHSPPPIEVVAIPPCPHKTHTKNRDLFICEPENAWRPARPEARDVGVLHRAEKICVDRAVSPIRFGSSSTKETHFEIDNIYREQIRCLKRELGQVKTARPQRHVGINFRPNVVDRALNTDRILSGNEVAIQCNRRPETRDACIQFHPAPKPPPTHKYIQTSPKQITNSMVQCLILEKEEAKSVRDANCDTEGLWQSHEKYVQASSQASSAYSQTEFRETKEIGCSTNVQSTKTAETNTESRKFVDRASSPVLVVQHEEVIVVEEQTIEEEEEEYEIEEDSCLEQIVSRKSDGLRGILKKPAVPEVEDAKLTATHFEGFEQISRSIDARNSVSCDEADNAKRFVEICDMDDDLEELYVACLLLNEHLFEPGAAERPRLEQAVSVIQHDWFQASADKVNCNRESTERLLGVFRNFSNFLLERVVNMTDSNGNSAIHHAISNGNWAIVDLLLACGVCDVNLQNELGYTPAMLCSAINPSGSSPEQDSTFERVFLEGNVNIRTKQTGYTALMLASERGFTKTVKMLLSAGAQVNLQENGGQTALMKAVDNNHGDTIVALLETGDCQVNMVDQKGRSAITRATTESNKEILHLLYGYRHTKSSYLEVSSTNSTATTSNSSSRTVDI